jgi:hypothetical protein
MYLTKGLLKAYQESLYGRYALPLQNEQLCTIKARLP